MKNDSLQKIQGTVTKVLVHLREGQKRVAEDLAHGGRQPQQWDMLVQRLAQAASHRGFKVSISEARVLCAQHGMLLDGAVEEALQVALTALGVEMVKDGETNYTRPGYEVKDRETIRTGAKFVSLAGKKW